MDQQQMIRRLLGAVVAVVLLAGCGAGQVAATAQQVGNSSGADADVGQIALRDVEFVSVPRVVGDEVYPVGAIAPLSLSIVNTGAEADRLVAVASPIAPASALPPGGVEVPGGRTVTAGQTDFAAVESGNEQSASAPVALVGLTEPIRSGRSYPVVFVFERAGAVQFDVAADTPEVPRRDEIDDPA